MVAWTFAQEVTVSLRRPEDGPVLIGIRPLCKWLDVKLLGRRLLLEGSSIIVQGNFCFSKKKEFDWKAGASLSSLGRGCNSSGIKRSP